MKLKTRLKIVLPMIISIIRILLIPFIILMTFKNEVLISSILIIIGFLTNIIDDKIAKIFYTKTKISENIDEISNILFILGISISFCKLNLSIIPISVIELLNLIIIIIILLKKELAILKIDKINRFFILITCIISFINNKNIVTGFTYLTINLTFLTFINYINLLIISFSKKNISIDDFEAHKKIIEETDEMKQEELMKTKAIKNLEDIIEKYEEK